MLNAAILHRVHILHHAGALAPVHVPPLVDSMAYILGYNPERVIDLAVLRHLYDC